MSGTGLPRRLIHVTAPHPTLGVWLPDERRAPHPLLCCAVDGLGPLGHEFLDGQWSGEDVRRIRRLVARMSTQGEGPLLALVDLPGGARPLVLFQPGLMDHGSDVISQTIAQAIATADERWSAVELQLAHPFGDGWPPESFDAVAEGIAGAADRAATLQRISLDGCCLPSPGALLGTIDRVRTAVAPPGLELTEEDQGLVLARVNVATESVAAEPDTVIIAASAPITTGRSRRCRPSPPAAAAPAGACPQVLVSNLPGFRRLELRIDGRALDGFLPSQVRPVSDAVRWINDAGRDEPIGLQLVHGVDLDLDDPAYDPLWDTSPHDAPALGLRGVSIGHILAVALMQLDPTERTPDRLRFSAAVACQDEDWELALEHWCDCLEQGDQMAHFAIGYSLMELERPAQAKEPLRRYTRLEPNNAFSWLWLGHACWALGDFEGAEYAYTAAVSRTALGSFDTDAPDLLDRVRERRPWAGLDGMLA